MKYIWALVSIVIAHAAGVVGSLFTAPNIQGWYTSLSKPSWNPPSWVFGPVWFALYTLIGVSAFLIWERRKTDPRAYTALWIYGVHLVLNGLWSIIFFGMHNPRLAFFEILLLDVLILVTLVLFWRIRKSAGILLLPYLGWALFATYLNYAIWMLN